MICPDARDLFSAHADAALSAAEQAELQAHLATCAECQREWARFERTVELLHAIEPAHAPAGFVDRVVAARPRPWYTRLARGLLVPWPVKLPLEAAAILLVAGLAIMIVQRSPELQQASTLNEAPPPVALPPEPAKEPLAAPSETLLSVRPEDGVRPKVRSVPESRVDARDTGVGARSRDQAQGAAESPSQPVAPGVPAERAKKVETSTAEERKEAVASNETTGGKLGAATAPSPAPATAPAAPAPARQRDLSASEQSVAKQATPERSVAPRLSRASSGLQARLTVADRAAAESTVRDLVTRAGGRVESPPPVLQSVASATILTLRVPADRWDELRRRLATVGTLSVTGQKVEEAGQLVITLRLER